jgi:hypothetical protein
MTCTSNRSSWLASGGSSAAPTHSDPASMQAALRAGHRWPRRLSRYQATPLPTAASSVSARGMRSSTRTHAAVPASERNIADPATPARPVISAAPAAIMTAAIRFQVRS